MSAKYKHECPTCTFIANRNLDIYFCPHKGSGLVNISLRYGNEPSEYFSNDFVAPMTMLKGRQIADWIARRCQVPFTDAYHITSRIAMLTEPQ